MPLTLRDGVFFVRTTIGELEERRWSDAQIIFDLNIAAQEMCSVANELTDYQEIQLPTGIQEGPLDIEVDQIKAVKFFSGQLYVLEPSSWQQLQTGAFTGSIPYWFYTKTATLQLTPQTNSSNIQESDLLPNLPAGQNFRTVVGCWPIPATAGVLQVWYSYFHSPMSNPQDVCAIPRKFLQGWASYAIAHCKRIESAYAEAADWTTLYEKEKEEYRVYAMTHKQTARPARYGMILEPWRQSASSSVILVDQTPLM
jgi:hypothetical protein